MSINEAIRSVCPSLSVKIALGIGLFNNALLAMGTERHEKYYEAAWKGEVSVCCCRLAHETKLLMIVHCTSHIDNYLFGNHRGLTW